MHKLSRVALAALLSVTLTGTAAGCGKSSDKPAAGSSSKPPASASPSPSPSNSPSSSATAQAGVRIKGNGYSFEVPKGWTNFTQKMKQSESKVDTAAVDTQGGSGFPSNLNVIVTPGQGSESTSPSQLSQLESQVKAQVQGMAKDIKTLPRTQVAGATALHQEGHADYQGAKYYLTQYLILHGNSAFVITFSFANSMNASDRKGIVDPVLASFKFS